LEEVGTSNAEIITESPHWHTYDLPAHLIGKALKGKYRGQKQRWFLMRFLGSDDDIRIDTDEPEFDSWQWATADTVVSLIVPFKRPIYESVLGAFRDAVR
jgi:putative (di)nucleoside polyphosphate hydrolase